MKFGIMTHLSDTILACDRQTDTRWTRCDSY